MFLSPRKLYVTREELDKIRDVAHEYDDGRLSLDNYIIRVCGIVNLDMTMMTSHKWSVEVVKKVDFRCGRNWSTRGMLSDRMSKGDDPDPRAEVMESMKKAKE